MINLWKIKYTNDINNYQNQINMEFLESFARKYGGVVIAGVVGAIIRRIRETMTLLEFLQVIFLGVFVSYCVGVAVEEYFEISEHFKYVIGAVSAIYSKEVLDEIKDVISGISESVKSWINKKIE